MVDHKGIFSDILECGQNLYFKEGKYLFYRGDVGNEFYGYINNVSIHVSIFVDFLEKNMHVSKKIYF